MSAQSVLTERLGRLRAMWLTLLQAGLATGLAWLIARDVVGHDQPFFAPVAAIITLGLTVGQRGRRGAEVAVGVALGIAVADLLVLGIGSGTWQLVVVTLLGMSLAVLLGGGPILVTQAAVSGILVVTLQPPTDGISFARSVDALVGTGVALVLTFLVFPVDPLALVRREAAPLLAALSTTLDHVAAALRTRERERAVAALREARRNDALAARFSEALAVGRETAVGAPPRRRARGAVAVYADAGAQVELAVRNVRVLARATLRAIEHDEAVPPQTADAVAELAAAVRLLGPGLEHPEQLAAAREQAVRAAGRATLVLDQTANLSVSMIVGTVRSTAVDLLRGTGLSRDEARALVLEAAGRLEREAEAG